MASITYVDEYTLLTFHHNHSSTMIYIESPHDLKFFHIEMLENFFKRIMFYCEHGTNIDINIQRLDTGDVHLIGYFYNKHQDYDICGTFFNVNIAIHTALSYFFKNSINNEYAYSSTNEDEDSDYYDESYEEESRENKKPTAEDLYDIGLVVDKILKNTQLDPE